ncbi:MAG: SDR family oxidoreductase [Microbacteriaceae bacterium]|nr:SDR family oxidoreductase [Microbacteriaceae bacterium]
MSRPIALITGATSGIGAEFSRQLARSGHDLVLVARDPFRLECVASQLRVEFSVRVEIIVADLTQITGLALVEDRVCSAKQPIDVLVNNAGLGLRLPFDENTIDDEQGLLDLMVTVPMRLTHAALSQMVQRQSGTIINVASIAAFIPRGTYGAAKAWLVSFSRWANLHYRDRGITVTAVAPGFVRTEFHQRMGVTTTEIPNFLWLSTAPMVRDALRDVARGRAVSIPSVRYKMFILVARLLPDRLLHSREVFANQ